MTNLSKFFAVAATAMAIFATYSCKTTEANYRAAYEKALAKQNEGIDSEDLLAIQHEKAASIPKTVINGDTVPIRANYANTLAEPKGIRPALRYNVVIAEFSQQFNATSAAARIRSNGCPDACVLIDNNKRFYVSAAQSASLDSAIILLHTTQANPPMPLRPPFPYLLEKLGKR